jgi:hypothetical protein
MIANHKNWFMAEHYHMLGEISLMKHSFELKLSANITDAEMDKIRGYLEEIAEEKNLGTDYQEFFYFQKNGSHEDVYLVVCTQDERFVNGVTNYIPQKKVQKDTEVQKLERWGADNKFFSFDIAHTSYFGKETGQDAPMFIFSDDGIRRQGMSNIQTRKTADELTRWAR